MSAFVERKRLGHGGEHLGDLARQHLAQGLRREPAIVAGGGERRLYARGHDHAEISLDQRIFELVELPAAQHRTEIIAERRGGTGAPLAKPREPALLRGPRLRGRSLLFLAAAAHAVILAIRALPS